MAKKRKGLDALKDLTGNKEAAKKAINKLQSKAKNLNLGPNIKEEVPASISSKRSKGRPPVHHGRKRFTTLISPEKRDILKMVALKENRTISDLFEEAADLLIEKYRKKYPNI